MVGESVAKHHMMVVCRMALVVNQMKRIKAEQRMKLGFQGGVETCSGWSVLSVSF